MSEITNTEIFSTARGEVASGNLSSKFLMGAMAVGEAFEWGTGNEALLGLVGSHAFQITNNTLSTGIAVGATSFIEQGLLGVGMALSIDKLPKTVGALQNRLKKTDKTETDKSTLGNKLVTSLALGTAGYLTLDNVKEKKSVRSNIKEAIGISALIGAGVTVIGEGAALVTQYGAEHGLEQEATSVVNTLSNPLTYLGLFVAVTAGKKIKGAISTKVKDAKTRRSHP